VFIVDSFLFAFYLFSPPVKINPLSRPLLKSESSALRRHPIDFFSALE